MQNLLIVNVRKESASLVADTLTAAGLPVSGFRFCTRHNFLYWLRILQTCANRNQKFRALADRGTRRALARLRRTTQLHITGCPNSCGQHWIADVGIEGKKIKQNGKMVDAYYFCVGGSVGQFASNRAPCGLPLHCGHRA